MRVVSLSKVYFEPFVLVPVVRFPEKPPPGSGPQAC
jgi:hypothetical protein